MSRYSFSFCHLRVRNASISARPPKNSDRLRHMLSGVYASATFAGSRPFHATSASRTFCAAVSAVNGGTGGRLTLMRSLFVSGREAVEDVPIGVERDVVVEGAKEHR